MTSRMTLTVMAALASGIVASSQTRPGEQGAVFRSRVDAVSVEVSVRSGTTSVEGLTAKDFVLLDNGVRQQIEVVDTGTVPLDVSLIVDTSGSATKVVERVTDDLAKIAALAGRADRLRLLTIDTYVHQVFPMQPATVSRAIDRLAANGLSSLYDAIGASMLFPVEPNRRHVVIALVNGVDNISSIDAQRVRDIARRSDATLHIGLISGEAAGMLANFQCAKMGVCGPTRRFWLPYRDRDFSMLLEAARVTGGELHEPGIIADASLASMFTQVVKDFRRGYILRYVPQGVARDGWHELTVRVPAAPTYFVHARKGYSNSLSSLPADHSSPAPAWAASDDPLPPAVESIVSAYDVGDYEGAVTALQKLPDPVRFIRDLKAAGNPWPANPRREAAFVIEVAEAALYRHDVAARADAFALLRNYHRLIRGPLGPDRFERLWYWTELTVVEGLVRPTAATPLVTNALKRFPDEPQFLLAQAIVSDQATPTGVPAPPSAEATLRLYDAVLPFEGVAPEAALRKAYLLHRLGRDREALTLLDAKREKQPDPIQVYLTHLVRAKAHDALGHTDEAGAAYRAALLAGPNTQAPRVGLMTLFFRTGDRPAAEQMAEAIEAADVPTLDPWWRYWQADYRLYPSAIAALREAIR